MSYSACQEDRLRRIGLSGATCSHCSGCTTFTQRDAMPGWAPAADVAVADLLDLQQSQAYVACGRGAGGSVRVVRPAGVPELVFESGPDYWGVTGVWGLPARPDAAAHALLLLSFVSGTRALSTGGSVHPSVPPSSVCVCLSAGRPACHLSVRPFFRPRVSHVSTSCGPRTSRCFLAERRCVNVPPPAACHLSFLCATTLNLLRWSLLDLTRSRLSWHGLQLGGPFQTSRMSWSLRPTSAPSPAAAWMTC
jgi:Mono-functional DNA-alkylating methyl methanesulfonate N-term